MSNGWQLIQVADFFYLLGDCSGPRCTSILQKRLKKEPQILGALYDLIARIDALGYEDGVDFAFDSERFDTIRGTRCSLIEIRRLSKTWRVICYWSRSRRLFVMPDAFEAHRCKSMAEIVKQAEPLARQAEELLRKGE